MICHFFQIYDALPESGRFTSVELFILISDTMGRYLCQGPQKSPMRVLRSEEPAQKTRLHCPTLSQSRTKQWTMRSGSAWTSWSTLGLRCDGSKLIGTCFPGPDGDSALVLGFEHRPRARMITQASQPTTSLPSCKTRSQLEFQNGRKVLRSNTSTLSFPWPKAKFRHK